MNIDGVEKNSTTLGPVTIRFFDDYIQIVQKWRNVNIQDWMLFISPFGLVLLSQKHFLMDIGWQFVVPMGVVVSVTFAYYARAKRLNATSVFVSNSAIEVKHEPVRWIGNQLIDAAAIKQLYVKKDTLTTYIKKARIFSRMDDKYSVCMQLDTGDEKTLVSGIEDVESALQIEQEVERYLAIEDVSMAGELK